MNYGNSGREPYNGLTKERGPDPGDLSETSPGKEQVWAVGWYNAVGAYQLGKIWSNRCSPDEAAARLFPDDTLSIKFLFTDANPTLVTTLDGSPEVTPAIDRPGGGSNPNRRVRSKFDCSKLIFVVKDDRSTKRDGFLARLPGSDAVRAMQNLTQSPPSPSAGAQLLARSPALRSLLTGPPPRQ
jgi:hypothetical protein